MRSRRDISAVSRAMLLRSVRAESGRALTRESTPPSLPKSPPLIPPEGWKIVAGLQKSQQKDNDCCCVRHATSSTHVDSSYV